MTTQETPVTEATEETPAPEEVQVVESGPKELRDALAREKAKNAKLSARVMKDEFAAIGLDPEQGLGKAIAKEYQGELDAEAIKEYAATEYGYEAPTTENPAQPAIDAGNARLEQVNNNTESLEPATLQEKARKAAADGDMTAAANAKAELLRKKFQ